MIKTYLLKKIIDNIINSKVILYDWKNRKNSNKRYMEK